jgi:hypothetical protein
MICSAAELQQLREENERLRRDLADTQARLSSCSASGVPRTCTLTTATRIPHVRRGCCRLCVIPSLGVLHPPGCSCRLPRATRAERIAVPSVLRLP